MENINKDNNLINTAFSDTDDWSKEYIDFVKNNKIMNGYMENGKLVFKPKNNITREEMAVIICNILDYMKAR